MLVTQEINQTKLVPLQPISSYFPQSSIGVVIGVAALLFVQSYAIFSKHLFGRFQSPSCTPFKDDSARSFSGLRVMHVYVNVQQ